MADDTSKSLIDENTRIKVSTVLNRDVKEYGKQFMFDGQEESCWNSDQGTPQYVMFDFGKEINLREIQVKFQGGFVGSECDVEGGNASKNLELLYKFYPDDNNSLQIFPSNGSKMCKIIKISFVKSTDFFGRITIYRLDLK